MRRPVPTLIRDVTVFDGERLTGPGSVLLRAGAIAAVGRGLAAPAGAEIVDGWGRTLLPGLIDSHVHASDVRALGQALAFGITTELDMFSGPGLAARRRALAARRDNVADIRTALQGASAPGGAMQRLNPALPTVTGPPDAAAFVRARVAAGADYLKVYMDDPRWRGLACLAPDTVAALVAAAHENGLLAVAHADSAALAHMFIDAGGDGLAHVLGDLDLTPEFLAGMRRGRRFAIATLRVTAALSETHAAQIDADQRELAGHRRLGPRLDPPTRAAFTRPGLLTEARTWAAAGPSGGGRRLDFDGALRSVAALHRAGVPVLAGTDANYPDEAGAHPLLRAYAGHGIALHHELTLLTRAGLTAAEALAAATSVPARIFGLADRGRIAPGLRADLLLVDGDPCADITATRDIVAIWRGGTRLTREHDEDSEQPTA